MMPSGSRRRKLRHGAAMLSRKRGATLFALALCLLSLAGNSAAAGHEGVTAARRPAKRSYYTHSYYVMELLEGSDEHEAQTLASMLGAELVEQVGELKDHWLLRAPFELEKRDADGEQLDQVLQRYYSLAIEQQGMRHDAPLGWLKQHISQEQQGGHAQLLSRVRDARDTVRARSIAPGNIVSLDKQVIKQRVKRQLPKEYLEHPPRLRTRQAQSSGESSVSQFLRDIAERFSIGDPLWPKQWHLANDVMQENSINVTGVWAQGITGQGIKVAIVDDGLDMYSQDLAPNFYAEGSWDYNDHTDLPKPRLSDDQHGTRCAGEIAAVKNDVCGVGVAYDAKVAGIRILSASISDADEASALNFGYQENDIYSCSWGPPDDGRSMEAPSALIYKSMLNGVQNGRGGKGSVFVFASGNGGAVDDQCNFDGYTNSIFSITVSAIDRKGLHPFYSEGCSANMVVTYSSGSGDNIHTTDVGTNKCTDHHGGTSAAAPIAAGIFALVLQVRPELTWRDMQHMVLRTAVQVNAKDPDWFVTHAGRPYNHKYGYGKLDAYRLVELARTWELVKPQAWYEVPKQIVDKVMTKEGVVSTFDVTQDSLNGANFESLEHVTITIKARHARRGNMEVWLDSPNGVRSILARRRRFDDDGSGYPDWTFMSVKHWDENPVGTWTVTMLDRMDNGKNGTFVSWSMMLWGQSKDASIAKPFKMSNDAQIHLPSPPHHRPTSNLTISTITHTEGSSTWLETTTLAGLPTHPTTKSYARPTAHLPGDHGAVTGESDHPLEGLPSETSSLEATAVTSVALPSGTQAGHSDTTAEEQEDQEDSKYLGPWSSLVGDSTWFYIAVGSVVIFLTGASAWLVVRKRQQGRAGGARGGGGAFGGLFSGYGLLSGRDDDDTHPMSALERGRGVSSGGGAGRTRALYDAFALDDSSEDDDDDDIVAGGQRATGQGARYSDRDPSQQERGVGAERMDDSYMTSFLGDEEDDDDDERSDAGSNRRSGASPRHSTPALVDTSGAGDGDGNAEERRPLAQSP